MKVYYFIILIGMIACAKQPTPSSPINQFQSTEKSFTQDLRDHELATLLPSQKLTITATTLPSFTPTPTWQVCSPLQDVRLTALIGQISNPYNPPPPGSDDPHEGIDLVDLQPGTSIAVAGMQVNSILNGKVAMVLHDRFPYGNAVMVETRMETLADLQFVPPTPAPTLSVIPVLTCPKLEPPANWEVSPRSIYVLYAHLQTMKDFDVGDSIICGQEIGQIGSSGNSLNPHLHLEIRIGPAGVQIPSLAHYSNDATSQEMAWYCTWRVSSWFQLMDPLLVMGEK
jgi:murein DD-endopeptidase MepM/ murein hydrolase activator NlpD